MNVIKPPLTLKIGDKKSIFLAGSIDNGAATDWQAEAANLLSDLDIYVLNPRREEWDASWEQSADNPIFKEQVMWELNGLEKADVVLFNFLNNSQAPISLLELGLCSRKANVIVCCENDYWRRGNVEIVCENYDLKLVNGLEKAIPLVRALLK